MEDIIGTWQFGSAENEDGIAKEIGVPPELQAMIKASPRPELTYEHEGDEWRCVTDCLGCKNVTKFKLGEEFSQMGPTGNITIKIDYKDGKWTETHKQPNGKTVVTNKTVVGSVCNQDTSVLDSDGKPLASGKATYKLKES